jgi:hypothetical protein
VSGPLRLVYRNPNPRIVDDDGTVAICIKGDWVDPFGGTFTDAEVADFDGMVDSHIEPRIARAERS